MFTTASKTESGSTAWGISISVGFCAKWQFAQTIRPVASLGLSYACCANTG